MVIRTVLDLVSWKPFAWAVVAFIVIGGCGDDSRISYSDVTTSNGTTATSNGTMATGNGTTATSNGTTVTSNGTASTSNSTTATSNGTTSTSNGTTSTSNGTTSTSNGTTGPECIDHSDCDGFCVAEQCRPACEAAALLGNLGCSFVALDLANARTENDGRPFGLFVTNPGAEIATVSVVRFLNDAEVVVAKETVAGRSSRSIALPSLEVDGQEEEATENLSARNRNAYRVDSNVPINVVQQSVVGGGGRFSNESSLLLPTASAGTHYIVLGWPETLNAIQPNIMVSYGVTLDIVSLRDDVTVELNTTTAIARREDQGQIDAGETFTEMLRSSFDVLHYEAQRTTEAAPDFTGTTITSDGPIAVFVGSRASNVPGLTTYICPDGSDSDANFMCCSDGRSPDPNEGCPEGTRFVYGTQRPEDCCADHLQEQLVPTEQAGNRYVTFRSPVRNSDVPESDIIRVLAIEDDTAIILSTGDSITLDAGQVHQFASPEPVTITAERPVLAALFVVSRGQAGAEVFEGDPAFALLPPASAWRQRYQFHAPRDPARVELLVAGPEEARLTLDGQPADCAQDSNPDGDASWRCAITRPGFHRLSADVPVGAWLCSYVLYGGTCHPLGWGEDLSAPGLDEDGDGELDQDDSCPGEPNVGEDSDDDGIDDACDTDRDGDGCPNDSEQALGADPDDAASIPMTLYVSTNGAIGGSGTRDDPMASIQSAVDAACSGVTIEVAAGIYNEPVIIEGKGVTLVAPEGPGVTIIDGSGPVWGGVIVTAAAVGVTIDGFTITGAAFEGVIVANDSQATLRNLEVTEHGFAGVFVKQAEADLIDIKSEGNGQYGVYFDTASGSVVGTEPGGCRLNGNGDGRDFALVSFGETILPALGLFITRSRGPVVVEGCAVQDNKGSGVAGVLVSNNRGAVTLRDLRVERNEGQTSGLSLENNTSDVALSRFVVADNVSLSWAGLFAVNSTGTTRIVDGQVAGNSAVGVGGTVGIILGDAPFEAENLLVANNGNAEGAAAFISGVYLFRGSQRSVTLRNFTVAENGNPATSHTGFVCDLNRDNEAPFISDSIVWGNTSNPEATLSDELVLCGIVNAVVDPAWDDRSEDENIVTDDPLFTEGPEGGYYLSQVAAGGDEDSPGVDAGAETVTERSGYAGRTTRIDGIADEGNVDYGFHYPATAP